MSNETLTCDLIDEERMRDVIRDLVELHGSQKNAAIFLGVSQTYLSDIMKKRLPISETIATKLGYERGYWYRNIKGESN